MKISSLQASSCFTIRRPSAWRVLNVIRISLSRSSSLAISTKPSPRNSAEYLNFKGSSQCGPPKFIKQSHIYEARSSKLIVSCCLQTPPFWHGFSCLHKFFLLRHSLHLIGGWAHPLPLPPRLRHSHLYPCLFCVLIHCSLRPHRALLSLLQVSKMDIFCVRSMRVMRFTLRLLMISWVSRPCRPAVVVPVGFCPPK